MSLSPTSYDMISSVAYTPISPWSSSVSYVPLSPLSYSPLSPIAPLTTPLVTKYDYKDALLESPVLSSLNLTYSRPTFGFYENLNADPELHERMVHHFLYYKLFGEYLYDELGGLLGYLKVDKNGNVHLIKSLKDYKEDAIDSDSDKDIEKKIEFIKDKVMKEKDMMFLLDNFVKETGINWYDLPHKEHKVMKQIGRYLNKKLRKLIKNE
jgi:hypothetical protein